MARLLIIEDNELNRDMLTRRLTRKGHYIMVACDGLEGVEMAINQKPDLILMDMSLPVLNGWDATRKLKARPDTCSIPVIALTAHAMASDHSQALEAGCDDFDTKPIEMERLVGKIQALLDSVIP